MSATTADAATILVVDDDRDNLRTMAQHLEREGFRVEMAGSGAEAFDLVERRSIDLALIDVAMPGIDGLEVLRRLKSDARHRELPVLMISELAAPDDIVRSIALGADDHLAKPFNPVLLRARITACLEQKRLRDRQQSHERDMEELNRTLERRVQEQVQQLDRLGVLKRFFSPQLADLIVAGGAADPLKTHRREITVVFLDLRGFTAFAETAEPEDVMSVLREYHAAMGQLILEHEGTLERFTGDGLMVFFNDPVEIPNPAERAVHMALAMQDRVAALHPKWRKRGHNLALGVGIAKGYATIGAIGFEGRWDYAAIGTVTNLAARLCGEASGGQILVSSTVAAAVEEVVGLEPVGNLTFKGLSKPVVTFAVGTRKPRPSVVTRAVIAPTPVVTVSPPVMVVPRRIALSRPTRRAVVTTSAVGFGLIGVWAMQSWRGATADRASVAVVPLSVSGGATPALADSIVDRLRSAINSMPGLRALKASAVTERLPKDTRMEQARALAVGIPARFIIIGDALTDTTGLRIRLTVVDTLSRGEATARPTAEGAANELPRIVDDLVAQLRAVDIQNGGVLRGAVDPAFQRARSPGALEALGRGNKAFAAGHFAAALREYQNAVEADSSLGAAYLGLSRSADWIGQGELTVWAARMAVAHLDGLNVLDQLRARAWDAYLGGRPRESEQGLRLLIAHHPGDVEATYMMGELLFHWGSALGLARPAAQQAFEYVDANSVAGLASLIHLARIAALEHRPRVVDSLVGRALRANPDSSQTLELRALRAYAGTASQERAALLEQVRRMGAAGIGVASTTITYALDNDQSARLLEAVVTTSPADRAAVAGIWTQARVAHGRWQEANARLSVKDQLPASRVAEARARFASLPFVTLPRDTVVAMRAALASATPDTVGGMALSNLALNVWPGHRLYLLGLLSARLGDDAAAAMYADSLDQTVRAGQPIRSFQASAANVIRATQLRRGGKPAEALAALGEPQAPPDHALPGLLSYPMAEERFLRGELLLELGHFDDALRWFGGFPDPGGYDLAYVAPALYRRAAIYAHRGNQRESAQLTARANAMWARAETPFQPWVTQARAYARSISR